MNLFIIFNKNVIFNYLFYFCIYFFKFLYSKIKVYYRPLTYKDKEKGKIIDAHKLYEPFNSKDNFIYWKFILSGLFLFPIKCTLDILVIISFMIHLKIFSIFYKNQDKGLVQYS